MLLLQNNIMDTLLPILWDESSDYILTFVLYVYEKGKTEGKNPMKNLAKYLVCEHASQDELRSWSHILSLEFLFDLTLAFNERCCDPPKKQRWAFEEDLYVEEDAAGKKTVGFHT